MSIKKSKTTTFSRGFDPQKIDNYFLGISKLNFGTKNEDFEQCDRIGLKLELRIKKKPHLFLPRMGLNPMITEAKADLTC